jgi:hypothetical protein
MQLLCIWAVCTLVILQWGYSYCCPKKQQSCCLSPYLAPDFLIHAIWTINSKREFETKCNGPLFNEKEVHFANEFPLRSQCGLEAGSIIKSLACLLLGQWLVLRSCSWCQSSWVFNFFEICKNVISCQRLDFLENWWDIVVHRGS